MKRIALILVLILSFFKVSKSDRIITSADIGRWYQEADLVIVSELIEKDSVIIRKVDSVNHTGMNVKFEEIQEKYIVQIDSIIKGHNQLKIIEIVTPNFYTNYFEYTKSEPVVNSITPEDDTLFQIEFSVSPSFGSNSYFRIVSGEKCICFLKEVNGIYKTIYVMNKFNDIGLKLVNDLSQNHGKPLQY